MAKWEIEYYDPGAQAFVAFDAEIDQIYQELSGDTYASFWLANTSANRALIQQDLQVAIYFDDKLQFVGVLSGGDLGGKKIKAICYEAMPLILGQHDTFTGVYDFKEANKIIADVLSGTGVISDSATEPTVVISAVFYEANRLDIVKFIAETSNKDFWSEDGVTIKWGIRGAGNIWAPSTLLLSKRGIDRSKQVSKVKVRGIDTYGYHIVGTAGSGSKIRVFEESRACDQTALDNIAAKKLAELNTDSSGAPVGVLMTDGEDYNVGDSVTVINPKYLFNGTYRILQLTKKCARCDMQVDRVRKTLDKEIADLKAWESKGIYLPGSTSWSVNLQGLIGLYHLNEGEGEDARNAAPVEDPIDGKLVNYLWEDGPITKMLAFNGDGYVNLGDASKTGINFHASSGVGKFSVGAWFSPSANDSTDRYVAHKDGQFALKYKVSTGVITFAFTDAGGVVRSYSSNSGVVTVGGRLCVFITYDGANVKMYLNGTLIKTFAQTDNIHDSANTVYLGMFLKGVLAEVMLWNRCLVAQEVLELYFFPLLRVVAKVGHGESPTNDVVRFKIISVGWTGPV